MDSMLQRSLQPMTPEREDATWDGYRLALGRMSNAELMQNLTELNATMQQQSRETLTSLLRDSLSSLDRPVLSSTPAVSLYPPVDRGAPVSPSRQQPSALDLLARSRSLAPRVASKLVLASSRARARR